MWRFSKSGRESFLILECQLIHLICKFTHTRVEVWLLVYRVQILLWQTLQSITRLGLGYFCVIDQKCGFWRLMTKYSYLVQLISIYFNLWCCLLIIAELCGWAGLNSDSWQCEALLLTFRSWEIMWRSRSVRPIVTCLLGELVGNPKSKPSRPYLEKRYAELMQRCLSSHKRIIRTGWGDQKYNTNHIFIYTRFLMRAERSSTSVLVFTLKGNSTNF